MAAFPLLWWAFLFFLGTTVTSASNKMDAGNAHCNWYGTNEKPKVFVTIRNEPRRWSRLALICDYRSKSEALEMYWTRDGKRVDSTAISGWRFVGGHLKQHYFNVWSYYATGNFTCHVRNKWGIGHSMTIRTKKGLYINSEEYLRTVPCATGYDKFQPDMKWLPHCLKIFTEKKTFDEANNACVLPQHDEAGLFQAKDGPEDLRFFRDYLRPKTSSFWFPTENAAAKKRICDQITGCTGPNYSKVNHTVVISSSSYQWELLAHDSKAHKYGFVCQQPSKLNSKQTQNKSKATASSDDCPSGWTNYFAGNTDTCVKLFTNRTIAGDAKRKCEEFTKGTGGLVKITTKHFNNFLNGLIRNDPSGVPGYHIGINLADESCLRAYNWQPWKQEDCLGLTYSDNIWQIQPTSCSDKKAFVCEGPDFNELARIQQVSQKIQKCTEGNMTYGRPIQNTVGEEKRDWHYYFNASTGTYTVRKTGWYIFHLILPLDPTVSNILDVSLVDDCGERFDFPKRQKQINVIPHSPFYSLYKRFVEGTRLWVKLFYFNHMLDINFFRMHMAPVSV